MTGDDEVRAAVAATIEDDDTPQASAEKRAAFALLDVLLDIRRDVAAIRTALTAPPSDGRINTAAADLVALIKTVAKQVLERRSGT